MYVCRHVDDMCILIAGSIGDRYPCILVFGVFNVILYTLGLLFNSTGFCVICYAFLSAAS